MAVATWAMKATLVSGGEQELELGPFHQGVVMESTGQMGQAKLLDVATRETLVRQLGPFWTITDYAAKRADRWDARATLFESVFIQITNVGERRDHGPDN